MDGLSAAGGVIAVIQISAQVYSLCQKYYLGVKDARQEIQRLSAELLTLQDVLHNVADLANSPNAANLSAIASLSKPDGPTDQCAAMLRDLQTKLESTSGSTNNPMRKYGLRALTWPLKIKELENALAAIQRNKSVFTLALAIDQTALGLAIDDNVQKLRQDFEASRLEDNQLRLRDREDKTRESLLSWLSMTDPSINHVAQRRKHQPETGEWLIQGPDFEEWKSSPNSFLWMYGTSGCGKTVLSSTIIQHLTDNCGPGEGAAVAYFYFDFNDPEKQKTSNFLSSIIAQLLSQTTELPEKAKTLWLKSHEGRQRPTVNDLKMALSDAIRCFGNVFIVADALDECPESNDEREDLLKVVNDLHSWCLEHLHFLSTSRRKADIEQSLESIVTLPSISIRGAQINGDIKLHVRSELKVISRSKNWPSDLIAEVEDVLVHKANGMFRWVFCQLDVLKRCLKPSLVRTKLKSLPKDLEATYARILRDIPDDYHQDAHTALKWLTFSERPLRLEELIEALLIVPSRDPPYNSEDKLDQYGILQILPGLVTITVNEDSSLEEIRLAHFSVKEYLLSITSQQGLTSVFGTTAVAAHQFITESCLIYILQYDQALNRKNSIEDLSTFCLLEYACRYWYVHKRVFSSEVETPSRRQASADALLLQLLVADSKTLDWLQVHRPDMTWRQPFETDHDLGSSLYYACCIGFREAVRMLLDKGGDVNTVGGYYGSPLRAAAKHGHRMTTLLLLDRGADLEAEDTNSGGTALWLAADSGHEDVVCVLLQAGANIEAGTNSRGGTALYAAASNRHEGVVRLLLKNSANVNAETSFNKTGLRAAAINGDKSMISLLLDHKADIETRDEFGETPLIRAAVNGKADAISLLLDKGANIAVRDNRGQNALSWAACYGQYDASKVLLDRGADMESKDNNGQTPLTRAAASGRELVVGILLARGADAKTEDVGWLTPLDWANSNGHMGVVEILSRVTPFV